MLRLQRVNLGNCKGLILVHDNAQPTLLKFYELGYETLPRPLTDYHFFKQLDNCL
ncbi:Histone-lysine N-methyltransferase SETMAR [Habropoda laboriosa]|uniref:Histone-lysine N-methyltransferase SETMAR n=1 Tax=Habropoda laboriosa TaxID=597456 RepID=A0A0L7R1Z1_9HYME|nr:Histone-lysine N-methyltransferase SETMAR [Habropoda laboriosa]